MGLINKLTQNTSNVETTKAQNLSGLTMDEYEFLFSVIKNSKFEGKDLEVLYDIVVKLQNQYLNLKK